jgi:sugar phosphate isomerase/epimerase
MSVDEWFAICDGFDIDGYEFFSGFADLADLDAWKSYRLRAESRGRSIPMLCHSSDFTHPDADFRRGQIVRQKAAIDASAAMGAKYCRILTGQRRPEVARSEGVAWVRESILECIDYAERQGVVLILENHYKDHTWLYPEFAQKIDVFVEVLAQIPESPWFGVNYDPSNTVIAGEDPIEMLEAVKHRVVSMHASDRYFSGGTYEDLKKIEEHPVQGYASILRHGIIGRGLNDYDRIFSILKGVGFSGWISIEDGPDPATGVGDIRESAVFLRKKMKEHGLP